MAGIEIDISKLKVDFTNHLNIEGNTRIIFSGPFGSGKTFFLEKLFKEKGNVVHLFPVNYSVSRNEDIFELIKFDLLYHLLDPTLGIDFEKFEFNFSDKLSVLLNGHLKELLSTFFLLIPKIGKDSLDIIERLEKLNDKILKETKDVDEKKLGFHFLKSIEEMKGSVHEYDIYTQLIQKLLFHQQQVHGETILIIDDLDRIDPEHIFRLLNVFAAHFDVHKEDNKFGFSKVVFVCDIENIRKIFHSKYGLGVDFTGYIDKFYSREVFKFDNSEMVVKSIEDILASVKVDDKHNKLFYLNRRDIIGFKILADILFNLVKLNRINLRTLLKYSDKDYCFNEYEIRFGEKTMGNWQLGSFLIFEYLFKFFGTKDSFLTAIKESYNEHFTDRRMIGDLLMIIDWRQHTFQIGEKNYEYRRNGKIFIYKVMAGGKYGDGFNGSLSKVVIDDKERSITDDHNYGELLYESCETLVNLKILK